MSTSHTLLSYSVSVLMLALVPLGVQAQNTYTVTNTNDSGTGSLRAAINNANDGSGTPADTIEFDISGTASPSSPHVVQPDSELPRIDDPVVIDGSTEPDYSGTPVVELDGQNAGSNVSGLRLASFNVGSVKALAIINFSNYGLFLSDATNISVLNNYIGVAADGSAAGNERQGAFIGSSNNLIDGNVISANSSHGITIDGGIIEADDNIVTDNLIGTSPDGTSDMGNAFTGIITISANGTLIGVDANGNIGGNVISGNGINGLTVSDGEAIIQGNNIGTNAGGDAALGNDESGVKLELGASGVTVGGTEAGAGNVISGNTEHGLLIVDSGTTGNTVQGNNIGTNAAGDAAVPNDVNGVTIGFEASNNTVGGTSSGARNVISGNTEDGLLIQDSGTTGNTIQGNNIGTNPAGDAALGNGLSNNNGNGIEIASGASANQIGSSDDGAGNVISGNVGAGVEITDSGTSNNVVEGNHIGTNADGTAVIGNSGSGVSILSSAPDNNIGGTVSGAGNVIAGNDGGLFMATDNNTVQGNFIGTNPNGDALGTEKAITISAGEGNQIGGSADGAGNVMGNAAGEIAIIGGAGNTLQGNYIGTNSDGDDLGTDDAGVFLQGTGHDVGGGGGAGNTIAYNETGVDVTDGRRQTIRRNRIFDNAALGIDLAGDGVTANDDDDGDTGINDLQNFPEIQDASLTASGDVEVTYLVPSDPSILGSSSYPLTVDFFKADASDQEGKAHLGTDTYSESSPDDYAGCGAPPCPVTITVTPPSGVTLSESDDVVATATDGVGNTSEFSATSRQLPVELSSFDAAQSGASSVDLSWTTASETNNAGFRVEHQGPAASSWSKLGFVEGHGTTTNAQSYRFDAEDLSIGTHRFRLKQVDLDGSTTLHDPVTVDLQMRKALRLGAPSPNPVQGTATASFAVKEAVQTQVTLYNVLGQQVTTLYRGTPTAGEAQSLRVHTSDLTSGVYFLRLQADGQSRTERLTVVR